MKKVLTVQRDAYITRSYKEGVKVGYFRDSSNETPSNGRHQESLQAIDKARALLTPR